MAAFPKAGDMNIDMKVPTAPSQVYPHGEVYPQGDLANLDRSNILNLRKMTKSMTSLKSTL